MRRSLTALLLAAGLIRLLPAAWYDTVWSDPEAKKKNLHSGNLVQTTFYNTGLVGRVGPEFSFEWPKGTGDEYIGDISICVGVEYYNRLLNRSVRSVAVTQSPARGRDEVNPADPSEYWTFMPLPGFANPDTTLVAMSHQRLSWPNVWPDKTWPGSWNGYFGRDVQNADQESYFWVDDSRDREFMSTDWAYRDTVEAHFPGLWEQSFPWNPDSLRVPLIQPWADDSSHAGLGLKVAVRGFQWSHALAEDVTFWLYDITNTSDIDYDKVGFGMVCGTLVGGDGDSGDDINQFDREEEFTYTEDNDDNGASGWVPVHPGVRDVGIVGYAFLESPGNNVDWIDNDGDSPSTDLPRLNAERLAAWVDTTSVLVQDQVVVLIDYNDPAYPRHMARVPAPGDTLSLFWRNQELTIYAGKLVQEDPANLVDDNFNGVIDENEAYLDAVYVDWGLLGLSPPAVGDTTWVAVPQSAIQAYDLLVDESRDDGLDNDGDWNAEFDDVGGDGQPGTGDTGERDGLPSPGEPHFDALDITESDQLGLTSFNEFTFPEFSSRNDEDIWRRMIPGEFDSTAGQPADHDFLYGAGYFPLRSGETQRISLAVVFGESRDDIFNNLSTVRTIYNENYNFIQPPAKPHLQAVAGDGRVTLYWDDRAEQSVDRISHLRDFEGYRIYRATDPGFLDAYSITDARGNTAGFSPVAQFDLVNETSGFFPIALNGTQYWLGDNSGLVHSWTDTTAVNGQAYFYAVTAYDGGDAEAGFLPAECAKQASVDAAGRVTLDVNTARVLPTAPAAGYTPGLVMEEAAHTTGRATGTVMPEIVDESALRDGALYHLSIQPDSTARIQDVLGWEYTAWVPDTFFTWDPAMGGYVAHIDSVGYDSTRVLLDEVRVPAFAWTLQRDGMEPVLENFPINTDTPQQMLGHPGIDPATFVARRLDTGDTLHIRTRLDTGQLLDADGAFDMDFDKGLVIYSADFLSTLPEGQLVETLFLYQHNLVHKQLVPNLSGYTATVQAYDPVVEGLRLHFDNDWTLLADPARSAWENAATDILPWGLRPLALRNGSQELTGTLMPHDYRMEFLPDATGQVGLLRENFPNQNMATILNRIVSGVQSNHRVWDVTDPAAPVEVPCWIFNAKLNEGPPADRRDPDAPFDPRDAILLYEPDGNGGRMLTWMFQISFAYDSTSMSLPLGGERYVAVTRKPFTAEDGYEVEVQAPTVDGALASGELQQVKVVPNPYLATAEWEARPIKGNRGDRKIQFIHLPSRATVRIYTVRGELVQTLHHESTALDGSLDWNLKSAAGLDVAYGMYMYHVDSPAGEKTGKFALIK